MESSHFFLVIADVEGKILKFNRGFENISSTPSELQFSDLLSPNSELEFIYSLELMLGSPKIRRHLMLDHPSLKDEGYSQVWWEFSVVTTPDMDISGIIGIGVGMQFLEQEMPWNNLVDVLGFGEIVLDKQLKIKSWDDKIIQWFEPTEENWQGKYLIDIFSFQDLSQLKEMLPNLSPTDKPKCFLLNKEDPSRPTFAALITVSSQGYHLFLMPKAASLSQKQEKPLIPPQMFSLFSGAVFVLNSFGKIIQQNEAAKNVGRIWKGRAYSEGFNLSFPTQANRFTKLQKAIDDAKNGQSTQLELKFLINNHDFGFWNASIKPVLGEYDKPIGVLIHLIDISSIKSQIVQLDRENGRLREMALSPSHVLRGPLSSMMGILELMDTKQLDKENLKLFNYLKPLTKELDQVIRQHSKKMSTFS
ncbi:hypothetical protein [Algoriphagus sp.]|uniref:hypothetical protein n=1 Tax=Algoriphagus sp. TaxID=1872435 RepID=UPI0039190A8F